MSQRHRSTETVPPPKMDLRAHAHNERHRINSALSMLASQVSSGFEPDEVHEPGRAWVPMHHHDSERAKAQALRTFPRHWKVKDWKRRSSARRARAQALRLTGQ